MSSDDVFGSFEKHEEITGEDSEVNAVYLAEESSFTRDVLKKLSCSDELGSNFIDDADKAYIILLNVFRYLPRRDLLSAARVCKVWNLVGSDGIFWKRISLNNLVISDVDMMVRNMKKYGTQVLDLRGMSFLMRENGNQRVSGYNSILQAMITFLEWPEKWLSLYKALAEIPTLTELTMEEYPQEAVTLLAKGLPQLKSLSAYHSSEDFFDLAPLRNMKELQTVKLINNKSTRLDFDENSTEPTDDIDLKLTTLTITRAINLSHIEHILPSTLVSLALGECDSLSDNFFKVVLRRLVNLNKLRLELCRNENQVNMLLESISKLPNLSEFELINFEVGNGFLTTINKCTNLKSLLLIPKYKFNSQHLNPLINYIILRGLSTLKNNLKVCVWVVSDINFKTSAKNLPILVTSHGFIPVYLPRVKKVHNCPLDKIVFAESPGLNFKIFRTNFSSTWMISLQNIKM